MKPPRLPAWALLSIALIVAVHATMSWGLWQHASLRWGAGALLGLVVLKIGVLALLHRSRRKRRALP